MDQIGVGGVVEEEMLHRAAETPAPAKGAGYAEHVGPLLADLADKHAGNPITIDEWLFIQSFGYPFVELVDYRFQFTQRVFLT